MIIGKGELVKGKNGAERDRTADLLVANEAFSQLNYGPKIKDSIYFLLFCLFM